MKASVENPSSRVEKMSSKESQACSHCPEGGSSKGQCEHSRDHLRGQFFLLSWSNSDSGDSLPSLMGRGESESDCDKSEGQGGKTVP